MHGQSASGPCARRLPPLGTAEFFAYARASTEKYFEQNAAVADGYRRIGRDFPAMGEHWIRASLLFDGRFEPSRPEVLNYIVVDGKRALIGVGYAVPLLGGETAPGSPAGASAWHDHSRTIEDETVIPHHHAQSRGGSDGRLAMLHAWIWAPNPAGMFNADNWAIPFLRLNLSVGANATSAAGKTLALATGGRDYFEMAIEAAGALSAEEKAAVTSAFNRAQAGANLIVGTAEGRDLTDLGGHLKTGH